MSKPKIKHLRIDRDGTWYARFTYVVPVMNDSGEITYKRKEAWQKCDRRTEAAVDAAYRGLRAWYEQTIAGPRPPSETPEMFLELADWYEREILTKPVYRGNLKVSGKISADKDRSHLKLLRQVWANWKYADITFEDLRTLKNYLFAKPVITNKKGETRERSAASVNHHLKLMRQIFNYAVRKRWMERSPFKDGTGLIQPSLETRREKRLAPEEERQVLSLARQNIKSPYIYVAIIFMVDGFFRPGELLKLKWSDIDLESGAAMFKTFQTKTQKTKTVYFTKRMREAATEWRDLQKVRGVYSPHGLVLGVSSVTTAWNNLRAKIGRDDLHFADLRHEAASKADEAGLSMAVISKRMGHSSQVITERYINPAAGQLSDVGLLDKINEERARGNGKL